MNHQCPISCLERESRIDSPTSLSRSAAEISNIDPITDRCFVEAMLRHSAGASGLSFNEPLVRTNKILS